MTVEQLHAKLSRHNALQIVFGGALCAVAPVLWLGSFWIARYLFYLPFSIAGVKGMGGPSLYVAWAFIALLAFEGLRSSAQLFDLAEFAQSDFSEFEHFNISAADTGYEGETMLAAWIVTQFLFFAPRITLLAIQTLRSVTRATPSSVEQAATIFTALEADRRRRPAREFGDCGTAIRLLGRLKLIWMQCGPSGLELRFPAGMRESELV